MMKITELRVRGFRSLSDVRLELHSLCILIGRNNAGKSNILRAISLLLEGSTRDISPADFHWSKSTQAGEFEIEAVVAGVQQYLPLCADRHRTKIANCIRDDQLRVRKRAYRDPLAFEAIHLWDPEREEFTLPTGIDSALKQLLPEVIFIEAFKDPSEEASAKTSATFGKLLKHNMEGISTQVAGDVQRALAIAQRKFNTLEEDGRTVDERPEELRRVEQRIGRHVRSVFEGTDVRVRFTLPTVSDFIGTAHIELRDWGAWTSPSLKGQGVQRALYVALLQALAEELRESTDAELHRPFVVLVEEPEAFLHPALQREMGTALEKISQSNQVVIATHSPLLVTPRHIDDVVVVRQHQVATDASPCTMCHWPQPNSFGDENDKQLIKLLEFASSAEFLFADCVMVVEGTSDRVLLEAAWSILRDSMCATRGPLVLGVIEAGSKAVVPVWITYLQRMGINACGMVDLDFLWDGAGRCLGADSELSQFCQSFWSRALDLGIAREDKKKGRVVDNKEAAFALVCSELGTPAQAIIGRLQQEADVWVLRGGEIEQYFGLSASSKSRYMEAGMRVRRGEVQVHQEISDILNWAMLATHMTTCAQKAE